MLQGLAAKTVRDENLMVKPTFVRGALFGATALAIMTSPLVLRDAAAKVGVTSATDGDPLGKPPQEAERVLRIGIDVQANELITTNANDRAHLVFLDGSSLTVGPNAQITIDKFVFDPNTKTGELAISASKGVLRVVGGKISKNTPIIITTPSSSIGIRGGISIHDVRERRTDSMFVFGKDMVVTSGGQTQTATRQGSMITANLGGPLSPPVLVPVGGMNGSLAQLEGKSTPSGSSSSGGGGGAGRNADQSLRASGFTAVNSNQAPRIIAPGVPDNFGSGPGPRNRNANETIVTALTNANLSVHQQAIQQQQQVQQQLAQQQAQDQLLQQQLAATSLPPAPTTIPPINTAATGGPAAGTPQTFNLPLTGTVTYTGQTLFSNGVVAGTYQSSWDFAARSGQFAASFDGAQFRGGTVGNGNSGTFNTRGPVQSSNTNRSITLNGAFYTFGNATVPQFQAGNLNVNGRDLNGRPYNANGVFYGQR
ncbi:MAG: FecR domain-containing protein [Reyranella sp.]|nr:FecR domain-containing protein [Reyranella sp.]